MYMDLGRISVDHRIMGGVPCVAGTRIPVATVVGLVANGLTTDEIMADYPQLTREDIQACLGYAARAVERRASSCFAGPRKRLNLREAPDAFAGSADEAPGHKPCHHIYIM